MTLYEIKNEYIEALENISIDEETGEVKGVEELDKIKDEFDAKAENVALYIKNLNALIYDIHEEEKALAARRRSATAKMNRLKAYLGDCMMQAGIDKFENGKMRISFRRSEAVEVDDEFVSWAQNSNADDFLNFSKPTANLTAIKEAMKNGIFFEHAEIVEKQNIQIK